MKPLPSWAMLLLPQLVGLRQSFRPTLGTTTSLVNRFELLQRQYLLSPEKALPSAQVFDLGLQRVSGFVVNLQQALL